MKHRDHDVFIRAIHSKSRVNLSFYSKEDMGILHRSCAPFDYGPSRRAKDGIERYHFWDFDSDSPTGSHTLSLKSDQIESMQATTTIFDPAMIITWSNINWFVGRDWGEYS